MNHSRQVASVLLLVPSLLLGQGQGGIEGRVLDAMGRPLVSAEVSVADRGGELQGRATTDAGGSWRVTHLAPGQYWVTVRRLGYRPGLRQVSVEAGRMTRLSVTLDAVPFVLDSLIASAPPLRISTTSTEAGTRLTVDEISILPTGIDARQLIALTPGARPNQIWGGASDQANAYLLDGVLVNHVGVGGALLLPSPSWIESLEVRGLGAGAELGNFQGGLVEVVTLSGGNRIEGKLRTSFESRRFNGSNLIPGEIGSELSTRGELDGQLRGPLLRDRLHFALFGQLIRDEQRVLNRLPGVAAEFVPSPPANRDARWLGKLTWKPGTRDLVLATLLGRAQRGERVDQTGYEAAAATEQLHQWNLTGSLAWKRSWSARSTLELRAGGYLARERRDAYAGPSVPGVETFTTANVPRYRNAPFLTRAEPSSLGLSAKWTLRGRLAGLEHEVVLGGEASRGFWEYQRVRNGGMTWQPWPSAAFDPERPVTWSGAPFAWMPEKTIGTLWGGEVRLDSRARNDAIFVQEQFRVAPWLRVNPGLRYGWWSGSLTPAVGPRFTAVSDQALEPRLGGVADLDGKGGLVAKGHLGRYHQSMFVSLFDRVEGADAFSDRERWAYLGVVPASPSAGFTLAERDALAASGKFRLEETVPLNQVGRVENYRQPYLDQAVLSLEKAFGPRWKARATFVHRRNRNQVALVDRNLASNYTLVENVAVRDRLPVPIYLEGKPLVLGSLAISNADIIRMWQAIKAGTFSPIPALRLPLPPAMTGAQLDALRYDPDFVLTTIPEANRRFDQLQLSLETRQRTWWASGSFVLTSLTGNFNAVSGPDDYSAGGPGPWVRLNEQLNFQGGLANQSRYELRLYAGGLLPGKFRAGGFFSFAGGDRVTPIMTISTLTTEYGLVLPDEHGIPRMVPFEQSLLAGINGDRMFLLPRGSHRFESRASLDLHLERGLFSGRTEFLATIDGFNVLGDRSVTAIETNVNSTVGVFEHDFGRVRGRVPPRSFRLGVEARF